MTAAEATVRFVIFAAIASTWDKQDPEATRDEIFKQLFEPHLIWAIKEHIANIEREGRPAGNHDHFGGDQGTIPK